MSRFAGEVIGLAPTADHFNEMIRANMVTTWSEVRRWAGRYATILREGLESIHESD